MNAAKAHIEVPNLVKINPTKSDMFGLLIMYPPIIYYLDGKIGHRNCKMLIDTGTDVSMVHGSLVDPSQLIFLMILVKYAAAQGSGTAWLSMVNSPSSGRIEGQFHFRQGCWEKF